MKGGLKTIYVCQKCDSQFPKWQGRCSECGAWGTLEARSLRKETKKKLKEEIEIGQVIDFKSVKGDKENRIKTGLGEFDRVLGGGLVLDSLVLLGGDPGVGKSTLVLQVAARITSGPVLYISGEESGEQVKLRLDRLGVKSSNLQFLNETDIEIVCQTIEKHKPALAIVDSIQTMFYSELPSGAGTVNQVRATAAKLIEVAKNNQIPIIIIGHVTKKGGMAGPKTLEHLVDAVLYLEGDRYHTYRILRAVKNRFGPTSEVGVFNMEDKGLQEVLNPSEIFLQDRKGTISGSVVTAVIEGSRAFLVEIQALVSKTNFGYPQRRTSGFDFNRLQLLIAVLTRRARLFLGNQDVHINVVGGFRVIEPAVDLAAALTIASAFKNKALDPQMVVFGEVGLGGELRTISNLDKRIKEAERLGFKKILMPETKAKLPQTKCEIILVGTLKETVERLFEG